MDENVIYQILSVVDEIPAGKVATYGLIAALSGRERNARLVGRILSKAEYYGDFPCHRVVNHQGRCASGWKEQRRLLEEEGVSFLDNGMADLKSCLWNPDLDE